MCRSGINGLQRQNRRLWICPLIPSTKQPCSIGIICLANSNSKEDTGGGSVDDYIPLVASPYLFPARLPREGGLLMWHVAGYYDESDDNERAYSMAGFLGHQ